jgi:hypothetical protein
MIRNSRLHNRLWGPPLAIFSNHLRGLLLAILNHLCSRLPGLLLVIFSNRQQDPLLAMGSHLRDPLPATGNHLDSHLWGLLPATGNRLPGSHLWGLLPATGNRLPGNRPIIVRRSRRLISSITRPHHCRLMLIILT